MIRVRHHYGDKWEDAWLVSIYPNAQGEATLVLAKEPSYNPDAGLELVIERNRHAVRILRRMIPLLDLEDGK